MIGAPKDNAINNAENIAAYIDHTLLKPDATPKEIDQLCEEALRYKFYAVCVNSGRIAQCNAILEKTDVRIACVVGFPLGANDSAVKIYETTRALNLGASEIDMVLNIGALKAKEYFFVENEIHEIVRAAEGKIVKVILETSFLNTEEKVKASQICLNAGAHFIKTSTGFGGGRATVEDIQLIKKTIGNQALIKASGGIKNLQFALDLIQAGANRLGTSSGVALVAGEEIKSGY